jgi:serine/threonine protein kinase
MSNLNIGLSGCKLELLSDNIIRKHSNGLSYNKRLHLQSIKQSSFNNLKLQNISAPKVLFYNFENLNYFDMEYCTGENVFQYLEYCSVLEAQEIISTLFQYFDFLVQNSFKYDDDLVKKNIISKLSSLAPESEYNEIINLIIERYDELNISNVKGSFCHGDLTFGNMLFSKNEIFFIDFLDSFIDSYLIDFAKIKQDLFYHWIANLGGNKSLRILQIFSYFWYNISDRYYDIINSQAFDLIDFINLLRIEPYANEKNRLLLRNCIESHKYYVNFNCSNGRSII